LEHFLLKGIVANLNDIFIRHHETPSRFKE
jgi:hypothetical protein